MEIVVKGDGINFFAPDEVVLNINFFVKTDTYEEVLKIGVESVENFVENLLVKNDFKKEDLKTRSFVIREEKKYDNILHIYSNDGFSFNQYALLKFDYDKNLLAKLMVDISKLENAPKVKVCFGLKDEKLCRQDVLDIAYNDAETKAQIIAKSAGKVLKECKKVSFEPFEDTFMSNASLDSKMIMCEKSSCNSAESIVNVFTPEDIEVAESLYCLWIAE